MPKKVLIALPPAMLQQVDFVAECEHRTRSDLIREALRRYLNAFRQQHGTGSLELTPAEMLRQQKSEQPTPAIIHEPQPETRPEPTKPHASRPVEFFDSAT